MGPERSGILSSSKLEQAIMLLKQLLRKYTETSRPQMTRTASQDVKAFLQDSILTRAMEESQDRKIPLVRRGRKMPP
ncbi:hypothetical protein NC653_011539 [Populus alba x Populus x berolinensis]|uniref:Uncharacterized protein n=1 Tax=Populus alba x Populus x berolinensis TaxID=444605 RepID=A0AAD6W6P0_9ROSI|nr:hypothetical protein NC653_011539 [Populus alba x Populus x berolinensis]